MSEILLILAAVAVVTAALWAARLREERKMDDDKRKPYFKIEEAAEGEFQAKLYGANHELVWITETYHDRESAEGAIQLARNSVFSEIKP